MTFYVPGTDETDPKKQNMSIQQAALAIAQNATDTATNTTNIATNTASISTINTTLSAFQAAWTAFTPTTTSAAGTITTQVSGIRYKAIGKTVLISVDVNITTNGTGATSINVTLPITSGAILSVLNGKEVAGVTQKALTGFINSGSASINLLNYDGTYPGANGARLILSGVYESA